MKRLYSTSVRHKGIHSILFYQRPPVISVGASACFCVMYETLRMRRACFQLFSGGGTHSMPAFRHAIPRASDTRFGHGLSSSDSRATKIAQKCTVLFQSSTLQHRYFADYYPLTSYHGELLSLSELLRRIVTVRSVPIAYVLGIGRCKIAPFLQFAREYQQR